MRKYRIVAASQIDGRPIYAGTTSSPIDLDQVEFREWDWNSYEEFFLVFDKPREAIKCLVKLADLIVSCHIEVCGVDFFDVPFRCKTPMCPNQTNNFSLYCDEHA